MRRTSDLENVIYKRKYKDIYKNVFSADLDEVVDHSTWYKEGLPTYIKNIHPLWIIIESKQINKRIWITNSFQKYEIATAQLDLDVSSNEYHDSYNYYTFENQGDCVKKLREIIAPCLEIEKEEDYELERS